MSEVMQDVELVFWNLGKGQAPTVDRCRGALLNAGLEPTRCESIPLSTAFRRAADGLRGKETLVRPFVREEHQHVQIDREQITDHGLEREKLGVYYLDSDAGVVNCVNGACRQTRDQLGQAYFAAQTNMVWGDVSKVISEVLAKDGHGAFSPRKNGGVYFVPIGGKDILDKLERFCRSVEVRFLRYTVPDNREQRSEAIEAAFAADLDLHSQAIDAYTDDAKLGTMDNRAEAIQQTRQQYERIAKLVDVTAWTRLYSRINDLTAKLGAKRAAVAALREAQPKGRRIQFAQTQESVGAA